MRCWIRHAKAWARKFRPAPFSSPPSRTSYDGVSIEEVSKSAILASRTMIEHEPAYSYVTARLLLDNVRKEVLGEAVSQAAMATRYAEYFPEFIRVGVKA